MEDSQRMSEDTLLLEIVRKEFQQVTGVVFVIVMDVGEEVVQPLADIDLYQFAASHEGVDDGGVFCSLADDLENDIHFRLLMTTETERKMRHMPVNSTQVRVSPSRRMPRLTAVTGSRAPSRAVCVLPMRCMACAVNTREMTVGKRPRPAQQNHIIGVVGMVRGMPLPMRTT